jgi:hypothetical protein
MNRSYFGRILAPCLAILLTLALVSPAFAASPEIEHFRFSGTDLHVLDCGTFFINFEFDFKVSVTTFFDQAGAPVQFKEQIVFNGQFTNETTGQALLERDRNTLFADLQSGIVNIVGVPFRLFIPGAGIVLRDAGKIIFDPATGEVLFDAGPNPYLSEPEIDALICTAVA